MTSQDFVYWLNGFVELGGDKSPPSEDQWKSICDHLKLTMTKTNPQRSMVSLCLGDNTTQQDAKDWIKEEFNRIDANLSMINTQLLGKADKYHQPLDWTKTFPGINTQPVGIDPSRPALIC
jgi:hypothetical protein